MANSEMSSVQQRSERKLPPPPKAAPWLVYKHGKNRKFQTLYNICDPMNISYNKCIPELSIEKQIWQKPCHQGWVVILSFGSKYGECVLWNPASLETIQLPNFLQSVQYKDDVIDCVLSSPPDSSTDDSVIYILFDGGGDIYKKHDILIYCRPGEKEWRKHEFVNRGDIRYGDRRLQDMFYLKGKLYISHMSSYDLVEIEMHGSDISISDLSDFSTNIEISEYQVIAGDLDCRRQQYLVASSDDVFSIGKMLINAINTNNVTKIDIKRLDIPSKTWEKVKSLNDYVFFLSPCVQLCCSASELGLSKGCVYFTQSKDMSLYKYDLEENSILLSIPCPDLPTPWLSPSWLMIPEADHLFGKGGDTDTGDKDIEEAKPCDMLTNDDISPLLVHAKYNDQVFNFVNPMQNNKNFLMNLTELLKGSRIRFSKGGWLLMSKDKSVFFYNPLSRSTIRIPDLQEHYHFSGISFSSSPDSSDCVVSAVDKLQRYVLHIMFIKKGDESWTHKYFDHISLPHNRRQYEFELSFNNPVFYHGAFYCLGINGTLGKSTFEDVISWEILTTVAPPKCDFIYKSFLVECQGNLLAVLLGHLGKWVRVFRLNDSKMVWEEVKNLGQHMLFLSNTSSVAAVAPTGRQMENKIYFPRLHNKGVLCYSLDTGMYHCLGSTHSAKDYRDSEEILHCTWIEPNLLETSSDHHLDWLSI